MSFLRPKAKEPTLDLQALQSYSPQWSPALRYTTCIAARYAASDCLRRVKQFAAAPGGAGGGESTFAEADKSEHFEEEGEDVHAKAGDALDEQRRQQQRTEYIKDWEEFAQKFATATCQHLGVAEESLPPAEGVTAEDVRRAALGAAAAQEKQDGADAELAEKLQAASIEEKDASIRKGSLDRGQSVEVVHELLLIALGLGQYRASDGSTTLFEQDMLFGDLPEDAKSEAQVPGSAQGPSWRSERQAAKAVADAETQAEVPKDQAAREKDAVEVVSEAGQKAWSTISTGALSGWKALNKGVNDATQAVSQKVATQREAPASAEKPASGALGYTPRQSKPAAAAKPKPKAATKPAEICHYDARARAVIFNTCLSMGLSGVDVYQGEKALAQSIYFLVQEGRKGAKDQGQGDDPLSDLPRQDARGAWMNKVSESTVEKEKRKTSWGKWAATGAGFAIGGVLIGLTGGLAAPVVAPALVGLTGFSFLATTGGIVLMGTLLGLGGGGLAGYRVQQRLRGLDSFEFVEVKSQAHEAGLAIPSLHATICVSGLILKAEDQVKPWTAALSRTIDSRDCFAVKTETQMMVDAGVGLRGYVLDQLLRTGGQKAAEQVIKHTAMAGLAAITLPLTVMGAASAALDGLFVRAKTKAHKAGLVLAETLRKEVQGHRPVILIGTSLGCTTILAALVELAKTPSESAHLIDSVFLIAGPMTPSPSTLRKARSIVGRRFVNAYTSKDMVCKVAAWLGSGISVEEMRGGQLPRVAGSGPLTGVADVENVDVSDILSSHFETSDPAKLEEVLRACRALQD